MTSAETVCGCARSIGLPILLFLFVFSGAASTISSTYQNEAHISHVPSSQTSFHHPILQTDAMAFGEALCFIPLLLMKLCGSSKPKKDEDSLEEQVSVNVSDEKVKEKRVNPWLLFFIPAFCDMSATALMYAGLYLTQPSTYQMLRGFLTVIVAAASVIFLKRKLQNHHYLGILFVVMGITVVGAASVYLAPKKKDGDDDDTAARDPMVGNLLIIIAQTVAAAKFVLEEKWLQGSFDDINPFTVVGIEGLWGMLILGIVLGAMYYVPDGERVDVAYNQFKHSDVLVFAFLANILAIATYNLTGIAITKYMSSSHRAVLDTVRTIIIWAFSLWVGWESFIPAQLVGFFFIIMGTFVYNAVVKVPCSTYSVAEEAKPLLDDEEPVPEVVAEQTTEL
eukprot:TRINITY_DN25347_c0_g1_i1.p1 TRINITY_DN25347_c0_g1~~TRINITY_DN25347_c0_g1_i1.p1  ORF type:complete len:394 (+),score=111.15 TRINITY_DN25347_c0_g1_i1:60-1241(+)